MSDFVEVILTTEDQQARSKQWYGDANFSEHEILETEAGSPLTKDCGNCKSWLMNSCAEDCNGTDVEQGVCVEFDPKSRAPRNKSDSFYSPNRDWTDEEMDLYL